MDIDTVAERERARDVDAQFVDVPPRSLSDRINGIEAMDWWRDGADYLFGDGNVTDWMGVLAALRICVRANRGGKSEEIVAANQVLADTMIAQLEAGLPE
jgi:hypothetical protein